MYMKLTSYVYVIESWDMQSHMHTELDFQQHSRIYGSVQLWWQVNMVAWSCLETCRITDWQEVLVYISHTCLSHETCSHIQTPGDHGIQLTHSMIHNMVIAMLSLKRKLVLQTTWALFHFLLQIRSSQPPNTSPEGPGPWKYEFAWDWEGILRTRAQHSEAFMRWTSTQGALQCVVMSTKL